jgi:TonB family protein
MTLQQELASLQRDRQEDNASASKATNTSKQQALEEHFTQLGKRLLRPSLDAPGVYERGPERLGEGYSPGEGGKYRSISSYGLKHVSYLLGLQRKIELVFSIPPFASDRGAIGVPVVGFTVRRDGVLAEAIILRSSGYPTVDKALLDAVKRAAPYHPFPEHLPDPVISIRVYATIS